MFKICSISEKDLGWPLYEGCQSEVDASRFDSLLQLDLYDCEASEALVNELLSSDRKPQSNSPLIFVCFSEDGGYLTITSVESKSLALVCFTSPLKALIYVRCLFGEEFPFSIRCVTEADFQETAKRELGKMGVTSLILDPFPFSKMNIEVPLGQIVSRGVVTFWAANIASGLTIYKGLLGLAKHSLLFCRYRESRDIALETIFNVEAEKPEIHFLLGQCALVMDDKRLSQEVELNLRRFGSDWIAKLTSFGKRLKTQSSISAIYEMDSDIVTSIQSLTYSERSRLDGFSLPLLVFWKDELPFDLGHLSAISKGASDFIVRILTIRQALWRTGKIPEDGKDLWEQAKLEFPTWPLFRRLEPTESALALLASNETEAQNGAEFLEQQGWIERTRVNQGGVIRTIYERPQKDAGSSESEQK